MVELLISNGANVNTRNNKGETTVEIAPRHVNLEVAMILLDHGADYNARSLLQSGAERTSLESDRTARSLGFVRIQSLPATGALSAAQGCNALDGAIELERVAGHLEVLLIIGRFSES